MSIKTRAEQLQWRGSKVVELRARGLSQIEIAYNLQVSEASINSDIAYLRNISFTTATREHKKRAILKVARKTYSYYPTLPILSRHFWSIQM
ncbi:MAG: hypothetical protein ACJ71E_06125 [Nitrososphaeraceae archaeon]